MTQDDWGAVLRRRDAGDGDWQAYVWWLRDEAELSEDAEGVEWMLRTGRQPARFCRDLGGTMCAWIYHDQWDPTYYSDVIPAGLVEFLKPHNTNREWFNYHDTQSAKLDLVRAYGEAARAEVKV